MNYFSSFKFWKKEPEIPKIDLTEKLVYTDKFKNRYYALKREASIPAERALRAHIYAKDAEYGLSADKLDIVLERMNEAINAGNIADTAKLIGILESARELYAEPEILLNLATCYVFMEDEPREVYNDEWAKKKRDTWDLDNDARSFFLSLAYRYTTKYSEQPQLNVPDYLKEISPVLSEINYWTKKK